MKVYIVFHIIHLFVKGFNHILWRYCRAFIMGHATIGKLGNWFLWRERAENEITCRYNFDKYLFLLIPGRRQTLALFKLFSDIFQLSSNFIRKNYFGFSKIWKGRLLSKSNSWVLVWPFRMLWRLTTPMLNVMIILFITIVRQFRETNR